MSTLSAVCQHFFFLLINVYLIIVIIIIADIPTPQAHESIDGMIEGPYGNIHLLFINAFIITSYFSLKFQVLFKC